MSKLDLSHNSHVEDSINRALSKIDFYSRYRSMSERFRTSKIRFENFKPDEVVKVIESIGYNCKYDRKERFFGINQTTDNLYLTFNISLKYGIVEFIWGIRLKDQKPIYGGPWGHMCSLLKNEEEVIKKPFFSDYHDLRNILEEGFEIYEDFKNEVSIQLNMS